MELGELYTATPAYRAYMASVEEKLHGVDPDLFRSPAMVQDGWRGPRHKKRHLVCRLAVHGFHFKFCTIRHYHERNCDCVCRFCRQSAAKLLHALDCPILSSKTLGEIDGINFE